MHKGNGDPHLSQPAGAAGLPGGDTNRTLQDDQLARYLKKKIKEKQKGCYKKRQKHEQKPAGENGRTASSGWGVRRLRPPGAVPPPRGLAVWLLPGGAQLPSSPCWFP